MKESTIKHLMGNHPYVPRGTFETLFNSYKESKMTHRNKEFKEVSMIYSFYDAQGKNDEEIRSIWIDALLVKRKSGNIYKLKPVRERRDNQNPETYGINYSSSPSCGNYPRIRVPSKKHKNRYKNFLKLFPQFKEK